MGIGDFIWCSLYHKLSHVEGVMMTYFGGSHLWGVRVTYPQTSDLRQTKRWDKSHRSYHRTCVVRELFINN